MISKYLNDFQSSLSVTQGNKHFKNTVINLVILYYFEYNSLFVFYVYENVHCLTSKTYLLYSLSGQRLSNYLSCYTSCSTHFTNLLCYKESKHLSGVCIIKLITAVINSVTWKASVFIKASKK